MWILYILFILLVTICSVVSEEFTAYTHKSIRDDNGEPCLTGCSSETHQCIINWKREKRSCKILDDQSPIYLTSQYKDTERKYCLSNCGMYDVSDEHEWCFTSTDFSKWDYCSSNERRDLLETGQILGLTTDKKRCTDQCSKGRDTYFWCHYNKSDGSQTWTTCALPALPRIPVLHNNFAVGVYNKGKCVDFFRFVSDYRPSLFFTSTEVPDNYVIGIGEAIEGVGSNILTQVYTLNEVNNPVKSYSMAKIKDLTVPVVIRAHITKDSIKAITNDTKISSTIKLKLQQQMSGSRDGYVAGTLIGFDLGGPNAEYNFVPKSSSAECDDWADMQEGVAKWCRETGGSVDMLVVVFYRDAKTPIPKAFGVSLVLKNRDHSVFVDCGEKVYWNSF